MADDKNKTRPQDAKRINVNEDYEMRDWCKKFGCTPEQLREAVQQVGTSAEKVEQALKATT